MDGHRCGCIWFLPSWRRRHQKLKEKKTDEKKQLLDSGFTRLHFVTKLVVTFEVKNRFTLLYLNILCFTLLFFTTGARHKNFFPWHYSSLRSIFLNVRHFNDMVSVAIIMDKGHEHMYSILNTGSPLPNGWEYFKLEEMRMYCMSCMNITIYCVMLSVITCCVSPIF